MNYKDREAYQLPTQCIDIIEPWNRQADSFNQWSELPEEEKIEFAYCQGKIDGINHFQKRQEKSNKLEQLLGDDRPQFI